MFTSLRKRKENQIYKRCNVDKRYISKKYRDIIGSYQINNEWVSASTVVNYMIDDPIIDYMYLANNDKQAKRAESKNNLFPCFSDALKNQGITFENMVMKFLKGKIVNEYRNLTTIARSQEDIKKNEKYIETLQAMEHGIPFIYQAVLHDKEKKVFGSPDLLVRNDFMKMLCENIKEPLPQKAENNYSQKHYYLVVDIKSSTLHLRANGNNLLNSGRMPGYKGQLYIYHKILSKIQNFDSHVAFVLGRKYMYVRKNQLYNGFGWFDRLGCINYEGVDKGIIDKTNDAIKWRRDVQLNHQKMSLYPQPSNVNLYPNMCNKLDDRYRSKKRKLAEHLSEHTLICWVGTKHRKIAHSKNIYRFDDPRCTIDTLGISGDITRQRIKTILEMNQYVPFDNVVFIPDKLSIEIYNWRDITAKEAYVDFETIPYVILEDYSVKDIPITRHHGQFIYLIGMWYCSPNSGWVYKTFTVDKINSVCEKTIMESFTDFVLSNKITKLYHWGKSAEPSMYRNSAIRNNINQELSYNIWCDMCTMFKNGNIGVKGAKTYGLKDIAKAMYNHKMIKHIWNNDDGVSDGFGAMMAVWQINNELNKRNYTKISDDSRMNTVISYNLEDCRILHEIMNYLRKNH